MSTDRWAFLCGVDFLGVCWEREKKEKGGIVHVPVFHCCIEQEGLYILCMEGWLSVPFVVPKSFLAWFTPVASFDVLASDLAPFLTSL